jgi:hypothetical protein
VIVLPAQRPTRQMNRLELRKRFSVTLRDVG